ncbi:MAG: hypothetical protein GY940_13890 [bacterium]|nr:hypothetical protein [bacterium]
MNVAFINIYQLFTNFYYRISYPLLPKILAYQRDGPDHPVDGRELVEDGREYPVNGRDHGGMVFCFYRIIPGKVAKYIDSLVDPIFESQGKQKELILPTPHVDIRFPALDRSSYCL